jgi:hypothetical protein
MIIFGVLLHLDGDPDILGRQVLDIEELRQLARQHHIGDPLDELRLVHRVRHAVDVDRLGRAGFRPDVPRAAQADAAAAGLVDLFQLLG